MKKIIKFLPFVFIFLVVISALFFIFLSMQKKQIKDYNNSIIYVASSTKDNSNYTTMTQDEKRILGVDPSINFEVVTRNASGIPTDYRIIK